ncbi:peptidoglycan recognition protein [Streptomyces sp. NPDC007264]|uniref:peptidoglycan recognition protein family protein n=1 Tax=Streptomyces sp. NPDC007264 TaxID=3364777 RepID=UPI0036D81D19
MSKIGDMRGYLASLIGVACAAVLAVPPASPAMAAGSGAGPDVPGSTQSLPLVALTGPRGGGAVTERGLTPRAVRSFSLVGVVWDDPRTELHGRVQIRTRASGTDRWSDWQEVETHNTDHGPDLGTTEAGSSRVRGSTAPLWVGDCDGIEVRVRAEQDDSGGTRGPGLPGGLRVELVDPGAEPAGTSAHGAQDKGSAGAPGLDASGTGSDVDASNTGSGVDASGTGSGAGASGAGSGAGASGTGSGAGASNAGSGVDASNAGSGAVSAASEASAANAGLAPLGAAEIPALTRKATKEDLAARQVSTGPYIGPRPRIVTRSGWGADESLREAGFVYTDTVKVAFVHHTASGNNYTCSQVPSLIRSIYRYHVVSSGWRDIGYNFLIDKCGSIYEGRAGGVEKAVMGAHTLGFNGNSTGIAVLGTYTGSNPTAAAVTAISKLTAWKLGLSSMDPRAATHLVSGGGNLYAKGENVRLNVISGHRDGFATECPGRLLYGKLGSARATAAAYQGR